VDLLLLQMGMSLARRSVARAGCLPHRPEPLVDRHQGCGLIRLDRPPACAASEKAAAPCQTSLPPLRLAAITT
jgi:hypothetical protein